MTMPYEHDIAPIDRNEGCALHCILSTNKQRLRGVIINSCLILLLNTVIIGSKYPNKHSIYFWKDKINGMTMPYEVRQRTG